MDAGVGLEVNAWREKSSESIAFIQWTLSLLLSPINMSKKSGLFHAGSTIFILPFVQQIGIQYALSSVSNAPCVAPTCSSPLPVPAALRPGLTGLLSCMLSVPFSYCSEFLHALDRGFSSLFPLPFSINFQLWSRFFLSMYTML